VLIRKGRGIVTPDESVTDGTYGLLNIKTYSEKVCFQDILATKTLFLMEKEKLLTNVHNGVQ